MDLRSTLLFRESTCLLAPAGISRNFLCSQNLPATMWCTGHCTSNPTPPRVRIAGSAKNQLAGTRICGTLPPSHTVLPSIRLMISPVGWVLPHPLGYGIAFLDHLFPTSISAISVRCLGVFHPYGTLFFIRPMRWTKNNAYSPHACSKSILRVRLDAFLRAKTKGTPPLSPWAHSKYHIFGSSQIAIIMKAFLAWDTLFSFPNKGPTIPATSSYIGSWSCQATETPFSSRDVSHNAILLKA